MATFDSRKVFFEELASLNKLIAHGSPVSVGSDETRTSFISVEHDDALAGAMETGIHFPCMVMLDLKGKLNDKEGSIRKQWNNVIWFLHKDTTGISESAKNSAAYTLSETVMNQVISRILNQFEEEGSCGPFKTLAIDSFYFEMTGRVANDIYGWRLSFPDESSASDITNYDSSKWLSE